MEPANSSSVAKNDVSVDLEWQVDSEWINLSSSTPSSSSKNKKGKKSGTPKVDTNLPQSYHFVETSNGGRLLVADNQTLRLRKSSPTGYSYWVCSIPCCNARCMLGPDEKMTRYSGDHNHNPDVSRGEYKKFINALKLAVKQNPHVKPKELYDVELEHMKESLRKGGISDGNEDEPCLPSFETVRTAMFNTRNTVLSSVSLKEELAALGDSDNKKSPNKSPRKKKTSPTGLSDLEELVEDWSTEPHKDANLSDFEEWLEEDVNANIPSVVKPKQEPLPQDEGRIIMPLVISPKKEKSGQDLSSSLPADFDGLNIVPTVVQGEQGEESNMWKEDLSLDNGRRKYRKRPASASVFTCPHCPYKSNRHFNVQRHERLAHSSKKPEFSCKECGTSYSLEYRLKLHIKAVHQGEGHHCHICKRTFETMTGLKSHIVTKHKHEDSQVPQEPPPELTCKLCGRYFSTKSHLMKHTSTHVMVQPYRCYMCNKAFIEECSWLTHQNTCTEPFTIQCCLCSAIIPTPQELLVHMDTVHGRSEYSCSCGKTFPWKKSLLTHQQKCSMRITERSC